jgi:hypothetical protein
VKVALKQTGYPCSEVNLRKHIRNHRVAFSSLAAACGGASLDSAHRDGRRPRGADAGACGSSGRVALAAAVEQGGVVGCWCEPVVSSSRPRFSPLRALLPRSEARWWGCAHHERRVTHATRGAAHAARGGGGQNGAFLEFAVAVAPWVVARRSLLSSPRSARAAPSLLARAAARRRPPRKPTPSCSRRGGAAAVRRRRRRRRWRRRLWRRRWRRLEQQRRAMQARWKFGVEGMDIGEFNALMALASAQETRLSE